MIQHLQLKETLLVFFFFLKKKVVSILKYVYSINITLIFLS